MKRMYVVRVEVDGVTTDTLVCRQEHDAIACAVALWGPFEFGQTRGRERILVRYRTDDNLLAIRVVISEEVLISGVGHDPCTWDHAATVILNSPDD